MMHEPPANHPESDEWLVIDDTESEEDDAAQREVIEESDRLDTQRIQKLSKLRRANYRSRSNALIVTIAAAVGAIQSGWASVQDFNAGLTGSGVAPATIAMVLIVVAWFALKWVFRIERELQSGSSSALRDSNAHE